MFIVVFRSTRSTDHSDVYRDWSQKMERLVVRQPGYQSHFSFRDNETGKGVTVSYFESEESIRQWHQHREHAEAQEFGRTHFYEDFSVEVAEIKRKYDWQR